MGYQALLFCPDEKLARVVSQVFSELDFTVEPVHEPFAAVKKLMSKRFDAVVVDCENEQNASLLFKSARNSSFNQTSLAIALVEGQAGVAKAYRIGANLVLTKPINVEQAKGTLRVARGLLRKNSDSAAAASAAAPAMPAGTDPVPASSSFQPASRGTVATAPLPSRSELPEIEAPRPAALPEIAASARVKDEVKDSPVVAPPPPTQAQITVAAEPSVETQHLVSAGVNNDAAVWNEAIKNEAANVAAATGPVQNSAFPSATGSAAAPAPAKEITTPPAKENKTVASEPASPSHADPSQVNPSHASAPDDTAPISSPMFSSLGASDGPSFGTLDEEDSEESGGKKKILIAAVAVLAVAVLGYLGYEQFGKSAAPTPARQAVSTVHDSGQAAPAEQPMSAPVQSSSTGATGRAASATQSSASKTATSTVTPLNKPSPASGDSPAIRIAAGAPENSQPGNAPGTKTPDSAPMVVKSNSPQPATHAQAEEPAPPLPSPTEGASANDSNLSGIMSAAQPSLPKPALATLRLSQGVSQGLLIKRVQPQYPAPALAVHAQGAVQIEATITKEGKVINAKVLRGDPLLAHAAVEAVREWRYKPYYLDGEPVEIQTEITINFKAN